jgi:hypothetical protein
VTLKAIRDGIITKARDTAGVQAVLGVPARVYPGPAPAGQAYPYCEVYPITDVPLERLSRGGNNTTWQVDVWYRGEDKDKALEAGDALRAALDKQTLTVTGMTAFLCVYEMGGLVAGGAADLYHYTSRYRVMAE